MGKLFRNPRTWAVVATVAGAASTYLSGGIDLIGIVQLIAASVLGGSVTAVATDTKPKV